MLLEKAQGQLWGLVGLGQDGNTGLLQNVLLGHVGSFLGNVCIQDPRSGSRNVLGDVLQVGDGGFKPVLDRAEVGSFRVNEADRAVDNRDGFARSGTGADVDRADRIQLAAHVGGVKYRGPIG